MAIKGEIPESKTYSIAGVFDRTGINSHALVASSDDIGAGNCVPLVVSDSDAARADKLHGKKVAVEGGVIFLADLNKVMEGQHGEINGRAWSGTRCESEVLVVVKRLEIVR
jgi:hypothetical protein